MTYKIEIYPEARDQIRALPAGMPDALADVMAMLELTPWNGEPYVAANPEGNMRQIAFGNAGVVLVIYLILENQRRVDVLKLMWLG